MADKKMNDAQKSKQLDKIKDRFDRIEANYASRNTMFDEIEKIFLMEWDDSEKPTQSEGNHIKYTVSPDARNKALGAIRLMSSTDPKFSVPSDTNDQDARRVSELIEKTAAAMFEMSGRVAQREVNYDIVSSAVLFGEVHIGIDLTKDWVEYSKGAGKAAERRIERMSKLTPVMFNVFDPRTGYPEYDEFGLSAYFRKVETKAGSMQDKWGEAAKKIIGKLDRDDDVDYCEYWDNVYHVCWIDENDGWLLFEEHNLPCIPIVATITDGSNIHANEEHKRQPFLYTLWKSELPARQNLMLTIAYSNMFAIAANPTFNFIANSLERKLKPDYSVPGGYNKLLQGESLSPMAKNAIDPAVMQAWEIAKELSEESSIFDAALGQSLGANAPYSMVALLNQAGRLPLVTMQKRGSFAIGQAMEIAFMLLKDQQGGKVSVKTKDKGVLDIEASEIPDDLIIDAQLKIDLPQDRNQSIQMAMAATSGEHPIMDYETARKLFVDLEQSGEIDKQILRERFIWAKGQQALQQMIMPPQPQMPPEAMQGPPPGAGQMPPEMMQGPPQGMPMEEQMSPEMQQQMMMEQMAQQQGAQFGSPMTEPLPPNGMEE